METRHTPGPWRYIWYSAHANILAEDDAVIARIECPLNVEGLTEDANVKLIAAAPRMARALAAGLDYLDTVAPDGEAEHAVREAFRDALFHAGIMK